MCIFSPDQFSLLLCLVIGEVISIFNTLVSLYLFLFILWIKYYRSFIKKIKKKDTTSQMELRICMVECFSEMGSPIWMARYACRKFVLQLYLLKVKVMRACMILWAHIIEMWIIKRATREHACRFGGAPTQHHNFPALLHPACGLINEDHE